MMFKNESDVVAKKAQTRYQELSKTKGQKSRRQKENRHPDDEEISTSSSRSTSPSESGDMMLLRTREWTPETMLNPSIEDQALGFFFSNFILPPSFVPRGQFEYLPGMLHRADTERILQASVTAAGLASFATSTKNTDIMKMAQEQYVTALSLTNKALQSTETAVKDSTLLSVIMLGMFENFRFENKESIHSWAKHIDGACTLIRLRGKEQLHGSIGHRIFQQFYGTILLVSAEARTGVPEGISDLWEANAQIGDYSVFGKRWTTELVRFMQRTIDLTQDKTSDPAFTVAAALQIDKELDNIKGLIPNIWKYETVYLENPGESVYGNSYHIYIDPWICQMWNNFRSLRLLLHRVLRAQLIKGFEQFPPAFTAEQVAVQVNASEQVMRAASNGICASVPQITGRIPFPELPSKKPSMSTSCRDLFDPQSRMFKLHAPGTFLNPAKPTGMHHLIWPIYSAASLEMSPIGLKEWAVDVLNFLALRVGTRQAVVLAEDLKQSAQRGFVTEMAS